MNIEQITSNYESLTSIGTDIPQEYKEYLILEYSPFQGYTNFKFYNGSEQSEHEIYIKVRNAAGTIQKHCFGCNREDFIKISASFENNPFMN